VSLAHIGSALDARGGSDNRGSDHRGSDGRHSERTPPHDLLAEQSAIGGMLLSKDATADVIEVVRGIDFYVPKHEVIFEAILSLYSRGEPTDVIAVTDELTKAGDLSRAGGADYLHTLTGIVPTAANAGFYASLVAEKASSVASSMPAPASCRVATRARARSRPRQQRSGRDLRRRRRHAVGGLRPAHRGGQRGDRRDRGGARS